jgi:hypothetical protein
MLSPLNEGISRPSTISVGLERGLLGGERNNQGDRWIMRRIYFANCPAILAILTTGLFAPIISELSETLQHLKVCGPYINTKLICRSSLILDSIAF